VDKVKVKAQFWQVKLVKICIPDAGVEITRRRREMNRVSNMLVIKYLGCLSFIQQIKGTQISIPPWKQLFLLK
jgi:hypothetical protein